MKPWLRLTLITMTVGGGFAGVASTLQALFSSTGAPPFALLLMFNFMGLYVFVIISGLIFVHNPERMAPLAVALGVQIPWISSRVVVYKSVAGAEAFIILGRAETGPHLGWNLLLGSSWKFALLQDNPLRCGVNVAALSLLVLLLLPPRRVDSLAPPSRGGAM